MPSIASLALGLLGAGHIANALRAQQIWEFPSASQWIENIALRSNGHLLLNTFDDGTMYTLNPNAKNVTAQVAVQAPGVTGLTGIAEIAPDVFAFSGGVRNATAQIFFAGTAQIFTVDFRGSKPVLTSIANVTESLLLNGLAALPSHPSIVFSVDSVYGTIYRTDTTTGQVDQIYQDELLTPGANATSPFGANGLKFRNDYLYITNTVQYTYGRIQINSTGDVVGTFEVVGHFPVSPEQAPDDLWFAHDGTAYVATHPNAVAEVATNGTVSTFLGSTSELTLNGPTSMILSKNQKTLYVATGGGTGGKGGQVIAVSL